jgi:hypothetical protein
MKVFVASEDTNKDGDFSFTVPGELVHLPPTVRDCPDCGCDRAMAGFVSHKATTSFVVRDLDLDSNTYAELLFATLQAGGWVQEQSGADASWVRAWANEHVHLAADMPEEVPLAVDNNTVRVRASS